MRNYSEARVGRIYSPQLAVNAAVRRTQDSVDVQRDLHTLLVSHLRVSPTFESASASSDGRYLYFTVARVAGLPGGGTVPNETGHATQAYRYDSVEQVVECVSCASSFDAEPQLQAVFAINGMKTASDNGDYVFFDTPAALVPGDVDGEDAPEGLKSERTSEDYSLSSDVYEWRRDGIGGCAHVQGCISLITSGHGGFLNILLGTTGSGSDVFFATKESLLLSDTDTAEDIYDARVDGGFVAPASPVECSGDACSTPFSPPSEVTPSSATFQGAGDIVSAPPQAKPKSASKTKTVCKAKGKKKCKVKPKKKKRVKKKASRAARRAGVNGTRDLRGNGRAGR